MIPPTCPRGHGPMMLCALTQGEGKDEIYLGRVWFCVNNDTSKADYCDECLDYQEEPKQMEMEL